MRCRPIPPPLSVITLLCVGFLLAFVTILFGSQEGRLPSDMIGLVRGIEDDVYKYFVMINDREDLFIQFQTTPEFTDFLAPYCAREDWRNDFSIAREELNKTYLVLDKIIKPALDRNVAQDEQKVRDANQDIRILIIHALRFADRPMVRAGILQAVKANPTDAISRARDQLEDRTQIRPLLATLVKQASMVIQDNPARRAEMETIVARLSDEFTEALSALQAASAELAKPTADYAVIADNCQLARDRALLLPGRIEGAINMRLRQRHPVGMVEAATAEIAERLSRD